MSNDDIVNQLLPYVVNEMRMPAGLTITVIEEIERMQAEIERLTKERYGWQATAAGLSQDISNAEDEIERLRAQVAELLPWVETSTYAPTALLARIDAGEFGT